MTKLTTERLEYYAALPTQPAEGDGFFKKGIFMYEVRRMARQLLAYEQAAKYVAFWGVTGHRGQIYQLPSQSARIDSLPIYRAPALPKQPELPQGFTYESGILTANFGNGDVLISDTHWPESGHAGISFAPVPQPKRPNLSDYTDLLGGSKTEEIGTLFIVKSNSAESLIAIRNKLDIAINALSPAPAQPVLPKWPSDEVERDALRYRFLRDSDFFGDQDEPGLVGWKELLELGYNELDAAIDARIAHPDIDYVKLDNALRKHIPAQPVIPEQRQMVPDERPADSSNGNDAEAWFDEGWNACRAEMLKAQPVSEPYKLPDGWVMVPQQIFLDASDIESICSQCGDGHKSGYGDFTDGLLWVGDIQCDNGTIMHGLHISSSDYQEDGGLTLAEFKASAQESE